MLATLSKLKPMLYIPLEDTSQDIQLTAWLQAASQAIEDHCNRPFATGEYTEQRSGNCVKHIALPCTPVHEVVEVTDSAELVEGFTLLSGGILYRASWPPGYYNLTVRYIGGYTLPSDDHEAPASTLPASIETACLMLARMMITGEWGKTEERFGQDYTAKYLTSPDSLPPVIKALLNPYVWRLG